MYKTYLSGSMQYLSMTCPVQAISLGGILYCNQCQLSSLSNFDTTGSCTNSAPTLPKITIYDSYIVDSTSYHCQNFDSIVNLATNLKSENRNVLVGTACSKTCAGFILVGSTENTCGAGTNGLDQLGQQIDRDASCSGFVQIDAANNILSCNVGTCITPMRTVAGRFCVTYSCNIVAQTAYGIPYNESQYRLDDTIANTKTCVSNCDTVNNYFKYEGSERVCTPCTDAGSYRAGANDPLVVQQCYTFRIPSICPYFIKDQTLLYFTCSATAKISAVDGQMRLVGSQFYDLCRAPVPYFSLEDQTCYSSCAKFVYYNTFYDAGTPELWCVSNCQATYDFSCCSGTTTQFIDQYASILYKTCLLRTTQDFFYINGVGYINDCSSGAPFVASTFTTYCSASSCPFYDHSGYCLYVQCYVGGNKFFNDSARNDMIYTQGKKCVLYCDANYYQILANKSCGTCLADSYFRVPQEISVGVINRVCKVLADVTGPLLPFCPLYYKDGAKLGYQCISPPTPCPSTMPFKVTNPTNPSMAECVAQCPTAMNYYDTSNNICSTSTACPTFYIQRNFTGFSQYECSTTCPFFSSLNGATVTSPLLCTLLPCSGPSVLIGSQKYCSACAAGEMLKFGLSPTVTGFSCVTVCSGTESAGNDYKSFGTKFCTSQKCSAVIQGNGRAFLIPDNDFDNYIYQQDSQCLKVCTKPYIISGLGTADDRCDYCTTSGKFQCIDHDTDGISWCRSASDAQLPTECMFYRKLACGAYSCSSSCLPTEYLFFNAAESTYLCELFCNSTKSVMRYTDITYGGITTTYKLCTSTSCTYQSKLSKSGYSDVIECNEYPVGTLKCFENVQFAEQATPLYMCINTTSCPASNLKFTFESTTSFCSPCEQNVSKIYQVSVTSGSSDISSIAQCVSVYAVNDAIYEVGSSKLQINIQCKDALLDLGATLGAYIFVEKVTVLPANNYFYCRQQCSSGYYRIETDQNKTCTTCTTTSETIIPYRFTTDEAGLSSPTKLCATLISVVMAPYCVKWNEYTDYYQCILVTDPCGSGLYDYDGVRCISSCASTPDLKYTNGGACVTKCDHFYTVSGIEKICQSNCAASKFVSSTETSGVLHSLCLDSCPTVADQFTVAGVKYCHQCPSTYFSILGSELGKSLLLCSNACSDLDFGSICIAQLCKDATTINPTWSIRYKDGLTCVTICSTDNFYRQNSVENVCATACLATEYNYPNKPASGKTLCLTTQVLSSCPIITYLEVGSGSSITIDSTQYLCLSSLENTLSAGANNVLKTEYTQFLVNDTFAFRACPKSLAINSSIFAYYQSGVTMFDSPFCLTSCPYFYLEVSLTNYPGLTYYECAATCPNGFAATLTATGILQKRFCKLVTTQAPIRIFVFKNSYYEFTCAASEQAFADGDGLLSCQNVASGCTDYRHVKSLAYIEYVRLCTKFHCSEPGINPQNLKFDVGLLVEKYNQNGLCVGSCPDFYRITTVGAVDYYFTCDACLGATDFQHYANADGSKLCSSTPFDQTGAPSAALCRSYDASKTPYECDNAAACVAFSTLFISIASTFNYDICVASCDYVDTGACVSSCSVGTNNFYTISASGQKTCTSSCISGFIDTATNQCIPQCFATQQFINDGINTYCFSCPVGQYFDFVGPADYQCLSTSLKCDKLYYYGSLCTDAPSCTNSQPLTSFSNYLYATGTAPIICSATCSTGYYTIPASDKLCDACQSVGVKKVKHLLQSADNGQIMCSVGPPVLIDLATCPYHYFDGVYYQCVLNCGTDLIIGESALGITLGTRCVKKIECVSYMVGATTYGYVEGTKCVQSCSILNPYYKILSSLKVCTPTCNIGDMFALLSTNTIQCVSSCNSQQQQINYASNSYCFAYCLSTQYLLLDKDNMFLTHCISRGTSCDDPYYNRGSSTSNNYVCTNIQCSVNIFTEPSLATESFTETHPGPPIQQYCQTSCSNALYGIYYTISISGLDKQCNSCSFANEYRHTNFVCSLIRDPSYCATFLLPNPPTNLFFSCQKICPLNKFKYVDGTCVVNCTAVTSSTQLYVDSTNQYCASTCGLSEWLEKFFFDATNSLMSCVKTCSNQNPNLSPTITAGVLTCAACDQASQITFNQVTYCNTCPVMTGGFSPYLWIRTDSLGKSVLTCEPMCDGATNQFGSFCVPLDCALAPILFQSSLKLNIYRKGNSCLDTCAGYDALVFYQANINGSLVCVSCQTAGNYQYTSSVCTNGDLSKCQKECGTTNVADKCPKYVVNALVYKICLTTCQAAYDVINTQTCQATCPVGYYYNLITTPASCVTSCASTFEYILMGGVFVKSCKTYASDYSIMTNDTQQIVKLITCTSTGFSLIQIRPDQSILYCFETVKCSSPSYLVYVNSLASFSCTIMCPYVSFGRICTNSQCSFSTTLSGVSLQYNDSNICKTTCSSGFYQVSGSEKICTSCTQTNYYRYVKDQSASLRLCSTVPCGTPFSSIANSANDCVSSCSPMYLYAGQCYTTCPTGLYAKLTTNECISSCPTYWISSALSGPTCTDYTTGLFINATSQKQLLQTCSGKSFVFMTLKYCSLCDKALDFISTLYTASVCILPNECATTKYLNNWFCSEFLCSTALTYQIQGILKTLQYTDPITNQKICVSECTSLKLFKKSVLTEVICDVCSLNTEYQYQDGTCSITPCQFFNYSASLSQKCVANCNGQYRIGTTSACVTSCTAPNIFIDPTNATCLSICNSDFVNETNNCLTQYSLDYIIIEPSSAPKQLARSCTALLFTILSRKICSACNSPQYVIYNSISNTYSCGSGSCSGFLHSGLCINKNCTAAPELFTDPKLTVNTYSDLGTCVAGCLNGYILGFYTKTCTTCVNDILYQPDATGQQECTSTRNSFSLCPFYINDGLNPKICVSVCPFDTVTDPVTKTCVKTCAKYVTQGICTASCDSGYFQIVPLGVKKCTAAPTSLQMILSDIEVDGMRRVISECSKFSAVLDGLRWCINCDQMMVYASGTFTCKPVTNTCQWMRHGSLCVNIPCSQAEMIYPDNSTQKVKTFNKAGECNEFCESYYEIIGIQRTCTPCDDSRYKHIYDGSVGKLCSATRIVSLCQVFSMTKQCQDSCNQGVQYMNYQSKCVPSCNFVGSVLPYVDSSLFLCVNLCPIYFISMMIGTAIQNSCATDQIYPISTQNFKELMPQCPINKQFRLPGRTETFCSSCTNYIYVDNLATASIGTDASINCQSTCDSTNTTMGSICTAAKCSAVNDYVFGSQLLTFTDSSTCVGSCPAFIRYIGTEKYCTTCTSAGDFQGALSTCATTRPINCMFYTAVLNYYICSTSCTPYQIERNPQTQPGVFECLTQCPTGYFYSDQTCVPQCPTVSSKQIYKQIFVGSLQKNVCQTVMCQTYHNVSGAIECVDQCLVSEYISVTVTIEIDQVKSKQCYTKCEMPLVPLSISNILYCSACAPKKLVLSASPKCEDLTTDVVGYYCFGDSVCTSVGCQAAASYFDPSTTFSAQKYSNPNGTYYTCATSCPTFFFSASNECTTCAVAGMYKNTNKECSVTYQGAPKCGFYQVDGTNPYLCVDQCNSIPGWFYDGFKCVLSCSAVVDNGACSVSCKSNVFYKATSAKGVAINLCIDSCSHYINALNGECVTTPCDYFLVSGQKYCNACPLLIQFDSVNSVNSYKCIEYCPAQYNRRGQLCSKSVCVENVNLFQTGNDELKYSIYANNGVCERCPVKIDVASLTCISTCQTLYSYTNGSCTTCSQAGEYQQLDGICSTDSKNCPFYTIVAQVHQCSANCGLTYIKNGVECVTTCTNFVENGNCVDSCASTYYQSSNSNRFCVAKCGFYAVPGHSGAQECADQCVTLQLSNSKMVCKVTCAAHPDAIGCLSFTGLGQCTGVIFGDSCIAAVNCTGVIQQQVCIPQLACGLHEVISGSLCVQLKGNVYVKLPNNQKLKVACTAGLLIGQKCVPFSCADGSVWVENGCYEASVCRGVVNGGVCVSGQEDNSQDWAGI